MFEEKSEKGLFTFYWEQTHDCNRTQTPIEDQQQIENPNASIQELYKKNVYINRTQKKRPVCSSHSSGHLMSINLNRQSKSILKPKYINIQPKIDKNCLLKFVGAKKKQNQVTGSSINELSQLIKHQSLSTAQKEAITDEFRTKQKNIKYQHINIQLPLKNKKNKNNLTKFNPIKKLSKFTLQSLLKKQSLTDKIQQLPLVNTQSYQKYTTKLPNLERKFTKKNTDPLKQMFSIEQLMLERALLTPRKTVVNLGQNLTQDEHLRWKLRKQKFLQELSSPSSYN